jgi:hypothetical protein
VLLASLEQKAFSVSQLAKRFEMGLLFEEEEGDKEDTIQGKELFQKLIETAKVSPNACGVCVCVCVCV